MTGDQAEDHARVVRNHRLFREVNERIAELAADATFLEFVCECAENECTQPVSLTLEEYEDVRREPNRYIVLPGHQLSGSDVVVSSNDRYLVVSKPGS